LEGGESGAEDAHASSSDAIRLAALFGSERLDPTELLQAADCAVEGSRTETGSAEARNVFDHRVPVLWSIGETGEDEQGRVGVVAGSWGIFVVYYVARTSHDVVIAYLAFGCKESVEKCRRRSRGRRCLKNSGREDGIPCHYSLLLLKEKLIF
jgi:hypothetical protein